MTAEGMYTIKEAAKKVHVEAHALGGRAGAFNQQERSGLPTVQRGGYGAA